MSVRARTVRKQVVRPGTVCKGSRMILRVRVRAGRAQRTRERALWTGKTAGGASECLRGGTFGWQVPSPVGSEYEHSLIKL